MASEGLKRDEISSCLEQGYDRQIIKDITILTKYDPIKERYHLRVYRGDAKLYHHFESEEGRQLYIDELEDKDI